MTRHIDRLAPALAAALLALGSAQAFAQTVGVNAAVLNDVRMTTQANPAIHKAAVKERVSLGNDIATGKASRLQILLLDQTNFTVGGNARVKIDRFVYDPNRKASAVGLSVARGAFRFMSGKPLHANPGQSAISTPIASIGIRGTIVEGVVGAEALRIVAREPGVPPGLTADPETASLILLRGPGPNAKDGEQPGAIDVTAGGTTVAVTGPGYAVFVPGANQPPIGPFLISDRGSAMLSSLLGTSRGTMDRVMPSPLVSNPIIDQFFETCTQASDAPAGAGGCN